MYRLPPNNSGGGAITAPAPILYRLPNYHASTHEALMVNGIGTSAEHPQSSEAGDESIRQRLMALEKRLDSLLMKAPRVAVKARPTEEMTEKSRPLTITLHYRQGIDDHWVKLLSSIGKGMNIDVKPSESLLLSCKQKGIELKGLVEIWKFLGTLIGLYPTEDAGSDKWLQMAEKHLAHSERNQLDGLIRAMGPHLGSKNFLGSDPTLILLPDIILRSLYAASNWQDISAPNNIQLWAKRVDSLQLYK